MIFVHKAILGIVVISLLGSATLAYGLSTEFLFKFDSGDSPTGSTSNSTHILVANSTKIEIFDLSGNSVDSFFVPPNTPYDVAVNSTHIFVTTNIGDIELFDLSGNFDTDLTTSLDTALGITVNSTHIFVVDGGSNDRVEILNLSGIIVDTVGAVELGSPTDVTVDSNGRIIVSDNDDDRIEIFDSSGNFLTSFASGGSFPIGVDVDSNDRIIVSDAASMNVKIFDSSGNLLTTFGSVGTDDGEFTSPSGLTVDSNDRIIVPDSAGPGSRIQVFAYVSESSTSEGSGGSGGCSDCMPPTLGFDSNGRQFVSDGFTYNGLPVDVQHFFTSYPLSTVKVGIPNNAEFRIYENQGPDNISHFEFAFGLEKGQVLSESLAVIEWDRDFTGKETVTIVDPNNILDDVTVVATTETCGEINSSLCLIISINHTFRESLPFDMIATNVWDIKRNSSQNYFNHGIHIVGDSLNPADTTMVAFGSKDMRGLYKLTQIDSIENIWIDEFGNIYQNHGNNKFIKISEAKQNKFDDYLSMHGYDRLDASFASIKQDQINLATEMMSKYYRTSIDNEKSFSEINDIFAYEYVEPYVRVSDNLIQQEVSKANAILKVKCPECSESSFADLSDAVFFDNIQADDTQIQKILQQENHDAIDKFNHMYGYIYNHDFYIVESFETEKENTSINVDVKESAQMEISRALQVFEQYGNIYAQD